MPWRRRGVEADALIAEVSRQKGPVAATRSLPQGGDRGRQEGLAAEWGKHLDLTRCRSTSTA
jgi:hypothetical protein